MTIRTVSIEQFAGLHDVTYTFGSGLTVVLGANETGKSTLLAAITSLILTPTALTPTQLERRMGDYLPRPSGNTVSAELDLVDGDGERLVLRKTWGAGKGTSLRTSDSTLRGSGAEQGVQDLLRVGEAAFRSLFVLDHSALDNTMDALADDHLTRDAVYKALRESASGAVTMEGFLRALDARIEDHFSRWDRDLHGPEQGRGIDRPWQKGAGVLLKAWYVWQNEVGALQEALQAEEALERTDAELSASSHSLAETEAFLESWRDAYDHARDAERIARERAAIESRLVAIRSAVRRWPVVLEERTRLAKEAESTRAEVTRLESLVAEVGRRREEIALVRQAQDALQLHDQKEPLAEKLRSLPGITKADVKEFAEAEKERDRIAVLRESGQVQLSIGLDDDAVSPVQIKDEGSNAAPVEIEPGQQHTFSARGIARLLIGELRIAAAAGSQMPEDLERHGEAAEAHLEALRKRTGAESSEAAQAVLAERQLVSHQLSDLESRLLLSLGERTIEDLSALVEASADQPSENDDPSAPDPTLTLADARQALGVLTERIAGTEREQKELKETYGSQDSLEDLLADVRQQLQSMSKDTGRETSRPEAFADDEAFITEYEARSETLPDLREARNALRVTKAEQLASLPERTGEEIRESSEHLHAIFLQHEHHGQTLLRLHSTATRIADEDPDRPSEAVAARVGDYLQAAIDDRFQTPVIEDGSIVPSVHAGSNGTVLGTRLLSQGTRDLVSLCIRLALADAAATDAATPIILDDPLVNMDPDRRTGAARAIARYAEAHQVLFLTCHPDHAVLFEDAERITMR